MFVLRFLKIFYLLILLMASPCLTFAADETISDIVVKGNKAVQPEAVTGLMQSKVGEKISKQNIRKDIGIIYRSGFFKDVRIDQEVKNGKLTLIVLVDEKPSIREIRYEGFVEVTETSLKDKITTKRYTIVDETKLEQDLRMIEQAYIDKGFYLARARYSLENVESGEVILTFHVIENNRVAIGRVNLIGNVFLSDHELKSGMITAERRWGSWMRSPVGTFKDDFVLRDKEYISYIFRDTGFAEADVAAPQSRLNLGRQSVEVSYAIEEGIRYNVGTVKISGDLIDTEENIKEKLQLKDAMLYRISRFEMDRRTLSMLYGDEGYAFADIFPKTSLNRALKLIDIEYVIAKGEKVYFRNIVIEGNSKTRDNVIRRALRVTEGERFHATKLDKSKSALERLGIFEEVQIIREPDAKNNSMDLRIRVKEKMTGSLNASIGASPSPDSREINFVIQGTYAEANLIGKGWSANFGLEIKTPTNPKQRGYGLNISFTEPSINDSAWSSTVYGRYNYEYVRPYPDEDRRITERKRIGLRLGREIIEDLRFSVGYELEAVQNDNESPIFKRFSDAGYWERVSQSLTYDKTDNYLSPTSGFSLSATNTLGVKGLIGQYEYGKIEGSAALYVPLDLFDDFRTNFRFALEPALVYPVNGMAVPISERLRLGTLANMKAYYQEANVISPRVDILQNPINNRIRSLAKGGNRRLYGTAEYFIPLIPEANLRLVTFWEAGAVLDEDEKFSMDKFKHDVGFGFRWLTPIAPFRFEWAWQVGRSGLGDNEFIFFVGYDSMSSL